MEAAEAAQVEKLARLSEENRKLEGELRGHHKRLETLADNNTVLTGKVATLKVRARATEEQLKEMEFAQDEDVG